VNVSPLPNQSGTAVITVSVRDGVGQVTSTSFTLVVNPVNDLPTISDVPNQSVPEDGVLNSIPFSVGDVESSPAALVVSATSSNPALIPDNAIVLGGSGANRNVTITPTPNQAGTATITLFVIDSNGGVASDTFNVSVSSANDAPTISAIPNRTIDEDGATGPLTFAVGDLETAPASLLVTAASSNPALLPMANLVLGGSGGSRTITATPLANQNGSAVVTVYVTDANGASNSTAFVLTVTPVDDPPTLGAINNVTVPEDAGLQTIGLTGISPGPPNESPALTFSAVSSNPGLVPNPGINYVNGNTTGTLSFTPTAQSNGMALVTVTVSDGNDSVSRTFTITVGSVNDAPSISDVPNTTTPEDIPVTLSFTIGDADTPLHLLTMSATSSNIALVPLANIVFDGYAAARTVTVTPLLNATGTTLITLRVSDGTATNSDTFLFTVTSQNDPPTLDPLPDIVKDSGFSNFSVPVTGVSSGAGNEVQTLVLSAASANTALVVTNGAPSYTSPQPTGTVPLKRGNGTGTSLITVTVRDGILTATQTFTLYVKLSANAVPTLSAIANQSTAEDTPTAAIPFTVTDATTPANLLSVWAKSSNPTLVPTNNIFLGGAGSSRSVTILPASNQVGTAVITISVLDTNLGLNQTNFTLTVGAANDAPLISDIPNQTVGEDASLGPIPFTVQDAETPAGSLMVTASSSDATLVPSANIFVGGSGTNRALSITPLPDRSGTTMITVFVSDGTTVSSDQFLLTVSGLNDPPTVSGLGDLTVVEDGSSGAVPFTIGDSETPAASLLLSAVSSQPSLLPPNNIVFGGSGASRSVTFTPLPNQFGTAQVAIVVTDGGGAYVSNLLKVVVVPVNDPPLLDAIGNVQLNPNAPQQTINLTGISPGNSSEAGQGLYLVASSSNPTLVPNPAISYTSPNATAVLTFTPQPNTTGIATITVTANDGQPSNNVIARTFTVTVASPPSIAAISPQGMLEDIPLGPLSVLIGDDTTPAGSIALTRSSSNQGLIPDANLLLGGAGSNRTITITPVPNQFGTATITLTATDAGGASSTRSFLVVVDAVNDRPTLDPIGNITITAGAAAVTVPLTGISFGAVNEGQTLAVTAISSAPGTVLHPSVNYSSPNATGSLQVSAPVGASGSATVTVRVQDNGSTLNGGFDTVTRSFTVNVDQQLVLRVVNLGNAVRFLWPTAYSGYVLESSASMPAGGWTPVPGTPQISGGEYFLDVSPSQSAAFFHLRQGP
jgi:hypothetical protein